jgi:regulator of RNase E activity RraA
MKWRTGLIQAVGIAVMALGCARLDAAEAKKAAQPAGAKPEAAKPVAAELATGKNYIPTRVFSQEDDDKLIAAFKDLRVSDVVDGMDSVGLQGIGNMDEDIHPLWRDTQNFAHRVIGVAVTARYVPTQKPPIGKRESYEAFRKVEGELYQKATPEPFVPLLRKGSVLVIEEAPNADVGSIGSNNIMGWKSRGMLGVISSATARDTDEIITEKVPLYFRHPGRGIRPGRNEIESVNRPVTVGGVLVMPGDVIVADGDGVVVVPRDAALDVAAFSQKILEGDKADRRNLYKKLGLPDDPSVK